MKKIVFAVVPIVLVAIALSIFWFGAPSRTILRNSSGETITSIRLVVQEHSGSKTFSRNVQSLAPGESVVLRHNLNDSKVRLAFTLGNTSKEHVEDYVDLWRGECWLIDVQPEGKIQSGYESSKND